MNEVRIAALVEGHGEVQAVPVLLRRIIAAIDPSIAAAIPWPFRHPSGRIRMPGGLERALNAVPALYPGHAILVLIDSDDDCPGELGPELLQRAKTARSDLRVAVVLAHQEFECWFLAAAESLKALRPGRTAPQHPERIRDAKGWLTDNLARRGRYSETLDQAAFAAGMNLDLARARSRSFRKLWREIESYCL